MRILKVCYENEDVNTCVCVCVRVCVCVFKRHGAFLEFVFQLRGASSIPSQGAQIPQAKKPKHKAEAIL